jgi:hypothetical protein
MHAKACSAAQSRKVGGIQVDSGVSVEVTGPFVITATKEAWTHGQATLTWCSEDKTEWAMTVRRFSNLAEPGGFWKP